MAKHKRLVVSVCVVAALVIAAAAFLFMTTSREYEPVSNVIFVNDDGSAQIKVDNINKIIQTHEDVELAARHYGLEQSSFPAMVMKFITTIPDGMQ